MVQEKIGYIIEYKEERGVLKRQVKEALVANECQFRGEDCEFNLSHLSAGYYLLKTITPSKVTTRKIYLIK